MINDALIEQEKKSVEGSMSSASSDIVKIDSVSETSNDEIGKQNISPCQASDQERNLVDDYNDIVNTLKSEVQQKLEEIAQLRQKNDHLSEKLDNREAKLLSYSREMSESHSGSEQIVIKLEHSLKQLDEFRELAE